MGARSGTGNFFLIAGIGFAVVGAIVWVGGGLGGSIVGMTFTMIGVIWALVAFGLRGLYGKMAQRAKAEQRLFETGTKAMAVVESVETTGMVMNSVNQQIVLTLRAAAGRAEAAAAAPRSDASREERTAPERVIEQLERLSRLREEGVLTESEFAVQKAKVLSGPDV